MSAKGSPDEGFILHKNGCQSGPFRLEKLRELLAKGSLTPKDLVWREGMPGWTELSQVIPPEKSRSLKQKKPLPKEHHYTPPPAPLGDSQVSYAPGIGLGVLVLVLVAYLASPFLAIRDLGKALESGDPGRLEERIDFPAVRQSLKDQVKAYMMKEIAKDKENDVLTAGVAAAFGQALIDGMVDFLVTPEGISNLIWNARLPQPGESQAPSDEKSTRRLAYSYAWFSGLTTFKVVSQKKDLLLYFHLKDFKWKLSRVYIVPD